jgi:hypothetical protein
MLPDTGQQLRSLLPISQQHAPDCGVVLPGPHLLAFVLPVLFLSSADNRLLVGRMEEVQLKLVTPLHA